MPSRAVVALGAAMFAMALTGCARKEEPAEPVRAVKTLVVADDASQQDAVFAADIRARTESRLGFRVPGKLLTRPVNAGDTVRVGQVLAELDAQDLKLSQAAAQAALANAQSALELATADLKRYRELREQGFIGAAELERRETAVKSALAQRDQAQAQASVQRNQAGYAVLVADHAGVVTSVDAEPGQVLAAGAPVVRVAQDGPRDAVFAIPEDKVQQIRGLQGRPGVAALQAWGSTQWLPVTIHEVSGAADPVTRTFQVKADVGRASLALGQTATVRLASSAAKGVIRLPLTAVVGLNGRSAVWLLNAAGNQVAPQPIEVAGAQGNTVVVASGLKVGDEVVVAGAHVLTPGQTVRRYVAAAAVPVVGAASAAAAAEAASH